MHNLWWNVIHNLLKQMKHHHPLPGMQACNIEHFNAPSQKLIFSISIPSPT